MLEYRLGFLCARSTDAPSSSNETWAEIEQTWDKHEIGGFSLWADPRLPILRRSAEGRDALLLGDAFTFDRSALSTVVDGLLEGGSWGALDNIGGRYAVLVISGKGCQVAHDAFGARSVFYQAKSRFAVASHAALLASAYGIERSDAMTKYMTRAEYRKRTVKYLPGDMTVYRRVFALVPNNYLDSKDGKLHRYWPAAPKQDTTLDDFHREMDAYFSAFVPFIASKYTPIFGITGGVDSRAVYCAFRRYGIPFLGVTWGAGYLAPKEQPIVEEIVSRLKIDHYDLDPKQFPSRKYGAAASCNSGNFRGSSTLTEAMASRFGKRDDAVFVRGYGGEILRGFYNLRTKPMHDLGAETLMGAYGSSIRGMAPSKNYKTACTKVFEKFRERANYDGLESFGYDPNDVFYWEHRMGMWGSAMLNEMDPAVYSVVGLNSRRLYATAFGLPPAERLTKQILKDVIARNDELLGAIRYE